MFDYIFQDERHEKIDRVVLVATDQPETTDAEYRSKDTIEFARILQRMIQKKYGKKVGSVRFLKIIEGPVHMDQMHDFFGKSLRDNKAFRSDKNFSTEELEVCYLEQTGGIPAANMALLYQCIRHFGEKCHPVYISERYQLMPLNFTSKLLLDERKSILLNLVRSYNYAAMSEHLNEGSKGEALILRLSQYAQHRLYFDTLTAQMIARQGMKHAASWQDRKLFGKLGKYLSQLDEGDFERLILELFHNMKIKYKRQEFVDFLGRLYRFKEAVPRYLIEKEFSISTDMNPGTRKQHEVDALLEKNPELRAFVASQKLGNGANIDPFINGIPRFLAMLDFVIKKRGKENLERVSDFFHKTGKLMDIRNKSIIGHGFQGVSEEIIRNNYDGNILEDLSAATAAIFGSTELSFEDDPFEQMNQVLTQQIQRL